MTKRKTGAISSPAKIDETAVRAIRQAYVPGQYHQLQELARRFGISYSTVQRIVRRETWKGVE